MTPQTALPLAFARNRFAVRIGTPARWRLFLADRAMGIERPRALLIHPLACFSFRQSERVGAQNLELEEGRISVQAME